MNLFNCRWNLIEISAAIERILSNAPQATSLSKYDTSHIPREAAITYRRSLVARSIPSSPCRPHRTLHRKSVPDRSRVANVTRDRVTLSESLSQRRATEAVIANLLHTHWNFELPIGPGQQTHQLRTYYPSELSQGIPDSPVRRSRA